MKKLALVACFLILFTIHSWAQVDNKNPILSVDSWKRGNDQIAHQVFTVLLSPRREQYRRDIVSRSGRVYRLSLLPNYFKNLKGNHWKIRLNEILKDGRSHKTSLGPDLLYVSGPAGGGDDFPREDLAAAFYTSDVGSIRINGTPWPEMVPFYPLSMTRVIRVEGFEVKIKAKRAAVTHSSDNKTEPTLLLIEFDSPSK